MKITNNYILSKIESAPSINTSLSVFIDILRIASAQLVFWGHMGSFVGGPSFPFGGIWHPQNLGVVLFFFLSGFLIVRTLPRYLGFASFFIDRLARIYLTFVPSLLLIVAMDFFIFRNGNTHYLAAFNIKNFLGTLFMLNDFPILSTVIQITSFGSARPLWTLSVEWWLYMYVGYLFLGQHHRKFWLVVLSIVPICFSTFERGNCLTLIWMIGGALALLPKFEISRKSAIVGLTVMTFLFGLRIIRVSDFYDFQACVFFSAFLSIVLVRARSANYFSKLSKRTLSSVRVLAGASFSFYILHYTVIELVLSFEWSHQIMVPASWIVANILSIIVYLLFDKNYRVLAIWIKDLFGVKHRRVGLRPNL